MDENPYKARRAAQFRYTIRDLLWLTALVGLACAWGLDRWLLADNLNTTQGRLSTILAELVSRGQEVEISEDGIWMEFPPNCSGSTPKQVNEPGP